MAMHQNGLYSSEFLNIILCVYIRLPKVERYFLMMDSQTIFETSRIHSTITRMITRRGVIAFVQALFVFGYKLL